MSTHLEKRQKWRPPLPDENKSTKFVRWINVVDASLHRKLESFQNIIKHITLSKFRPRYLVRFYYPIMITTKKFCEQEKKPAKFLSKLWSFYPKFKLWSITLRETEKHCIECLMAEGCIVLIYFSKLQFKKCNFKSTLIRRLPGDTRIESRPVNKYVTFLNFKGSISYLNEGLGIRAHAYANAIIINTMLTPLPRRPLR